MITMAFKYVVLFGFIAFVSGQQFFKGVCPDATTVKNFDMRAYMGKWFEIKRYEAKFQEGGECVTAEYTLLPNATVEVKNSQITAEGKYDYLIGNGREANPGKNDGQLKVNFPNRGPEGDYWVLGTDYKTYSVVWACAEITPQTNLQFLWILSRKPTLSDETWKTVHEILSANKVDPTRARPGLTKQDEKTCADKPDHLKY